MTSGYFLSSKISGTYQTSLSAKEAILKNTLKPRSKLSTLLILPWLWVILLLKPLKAQVESSLVEITAFAKQIIEQMRFYFVPATLEYLRKGGRIGSAVALVGSILI